MAGRPSKLTPEMQTQIVQLLSAGNFVETVCDYVGIHKDTFYEWFSRGERGWQKDQKPINYVEFSDAVKKAISQVEITTVNDLRKGPQNWQAKAWWLERRHPDKWGNRQRNTQINYNVDLSSLPDEILERLAAGENVDLSTIKSKG